MSINKMLSDLRDCVRNNDLSGFFDCYAGRDGAIYRTVDGEYMGFMLLTRYGDIIDADGRMNQLTLDGHGDFRLCEWALYDTVYEYGAECFKTADPLDIMEVEG